MSLSDLFKIRSFNAYLRWERLKDDHIPDDAVSAGTDPIDGSTVFIGRVEREGHIIPGAIRNGSCRFRFKNEWHTETERVEVLRDKFNMANKALVWRVPKERNSDEYVLPLWAEVGGVQSTYLEQNESTGLYVIARYKGTLDIIPLAVNANDRHFDENFILYKGPEREFEVLDCEYANYVAICPSAPEGDSASP